MVVRHLDGVVPKPKPDTQKSLARGVSIGLLAFCCKVCGPKHKTVRDFRSLGLVFHGV